MSVDLRLALLMCDEPAPHIKAVHGDYEQIFTQLLSSSLARTNSGATHTFTLDAYDVVKDIKYPPDNVHYDGLLISGSRASAYENVEWINNLVTYVRRIVTDKPSMKVFGICFGHQIVARALGGSCVQNDGQWEIAVTTVQLTPLGKAIFGTDQLDIQQMHRDHVPTSPPNAHLLGSTDLTPNQGMVMFDPASAPTPENLASDAPNIPLTSIHVLTVQGHPEFTPSIVSMTIDARAGIFGEALTNDGRSRAAGIPGKHHPDGLACDGVGRIGKAMWGVLGVV